MEIEKFYKNWLVCVPIVLFLIFSSWWAVLFQKDLSLTENNRQLFDALYQIIAIYGGIVGIFIASKWGGYKSALGKALLFFSIGLLLQAFGQSVYSYFIYFQKIAVPYPSLGDVGFFGSVIAYIMGAVYLAHVSGFRFSFRSLKGRLIAVLVPLFLLAFSYFFFLQGYEYDWSNKLRVFLDFGYPMGQAIYVSVALMAFFASLGILGGIMRKPITFVIIALFFQYFSDFIFLYQSSRGTWYVGGINDYLYFISYCIMTLALIYMGSVFNKVKTMQ